MKSAASACYQPHQPLKAYIFFVTIEMSERFVWNTLAKSGEWEWSDM